MKTIKENVRKSIVDKLNRLLQVENDLIFNYPQVIDRLVREENIDDKQLLESIETAAKESLRHHDEVDKWIGKLGGETIWDLKIVSSSVDVKELILQQLEKEKWAISWYNSVKKIAEQNKVNAAGIIGMVMGSGNVLPEDFVNVDEFINMLERHIADEERHIKICHHAVEVLSVLKNKQHNV